MWQPPLSSVRSEETTPAPIMSHRQIMFVM